MSRGLGDVYKRQVYMKSMGELYDFIKEQARSNGNELLQFIEGKIDE